MQNRLTSKPSRPALFFLLAAAALWVPPAAIASAARQTPQAKAVDPAQPLSVSERSEIIEQLATALRTQYVFPDAGETMATSVEGALVEGAYDKLSDRAAFCEFITRQLRELCYDKHLRLRLERPNTGQGMLRREEPVNHGFVKVEYLKGEIGYLKFDFFSSDPAAEATAAAAMNFLANSKAIIFDLRENGGGSPEMIAFLTSYLFNVRVHLNSFYHRPSGETKESWTRVDVPGPKPDPDVPVFVLTSGYTFSGAEEFSYNLKYMGRGTIVGEVTGGGAHPVMPVSLGNGIEMSMPFARAINPITETNWEGVGVQPDVLTPSSAALDKAIELAREAIAAGAKEQ